MRRLGLFAALALAVSMSAGADSNMLWRIENVVIIDGTGAPRYEDSVLINGPYISNIGGTDDARYPSVDEVVDGQGLVLAPGFIDTHSHADAELAEQRDALAHVSQGITTAVIGQDGGSPFPLAEWFAALEQAPAALNVASYAGHGNIREAVIGDGERRIATPGEVEQMGALLQRELDAGALGLGTGLEYEPGIWSEPVEVIALAKIAAAAGGRYISHIRSEDRWFWKAVEEIIDIGRHTGMPVQISHIKLAQKSSWHQAPRLIGMLDAARAEGIEVSADIYPYTYWQSDIMVLIPSRDVEDRAAYEYALAEIVPPEGFWFTKFAPNPDYVGKRLTEIAEEMGTDPVTALMQLNRASEAWSTEHGEDANGIIGTSMTEEDIAALMRWPHTNFCTDGSLDDGHPRGWGTYPRILGRYVRELGVMSLEDAIHKATALAARHTGILGRGTIEPGNYADLVLFDPDAVIDHATPENPTALSTGIKKVWVNGDLVFEEGRATGRYPGVILRRPLPARKRGE